MIYSDKSVVLIQKDNLKYTGTKSDNTLLNQLTRPINLIDNSFFSLGPTCLVEWSDD